MRPDFLMAVSLFFGSPAFATNFAPLGTPPGTPPNPYIQVVNGAVTLANQSGGSNLTAGQFGYTAPTAPVPVVLPPNPGLQFTPPPAFTPQAPSNAKAPSSSYDLPIIPPPPNFFPDPSGNGSQLEIDQAALAADIAARAVDQKALQAAKEQKERDERVAAQDKAASDGAAAKQKLVAQSAQKLDAAKSASANANQQLESAQAQLASAKASLASLNASLGADGAMPPGMTASSYVASQNRANEQIAAATKLVSEQQKVVATASSDLRSAELHHQSSLDTPPAIALSYVKDQEAREAATVRAMAPEEAKALLDKASAEAAKLGGAATPEQMAERAKAAMIDAAARAGSVGLPDGSIVTVGAGAQVSLSGSGAGLALDVKSGDVTLLQPSANASQIKVAAGDATATFKGGLSAVAATSSGVSIVTTGTSNTFASANGAVTAIAPNTSLAQSFGSSAGPTVTPVAGSTAALVQSFANKVSAPQLASPVLVAAAPVAVESRPAPSPFSEPQGVPAPVGGGIPGRDPLEAAPVTGNRAVSITIKY